MVALLHILVKFVNLFLVLNVKLLVNVKHVLQDIIMTKRQTLFVVKL